MRQVNFFSRIAQMIGYSFAVFTSRHTPLYVKVLLALGLLYAISPYDLIPEWVPFVGILDDLALAALLISWANTFKLPKK